MLKTIGWILLIPGAVVFIGALLTAVMTPSTIVIAITVGIFVIAFLTPALLFALSDIVQNTRETRDAVRALSGIVLAHAPEPDSGSSWRGAVEGSAEMQEAGAKARARSDAARLRRDASDT